MLRDGLHAVHRTPLEVRTARKPPIRRHTLPIPCASTPAAMPRSATIPPPGPPAAGDQHAGGVLRPTRAAARTGRSRVRGSDADPEQRRAVESAASTTKRISPRCAVSPAWMACPIFASKRRRQRPARICPGRLPASAVRCWMFMATTDAPPPRKPPPPPSRRHHDRPARLPPKPPGRPRPTACHTAQTGVITATLPVVNEQHAARRLPRATMEHWKVGHHRYPLIHRAVWLMARGKGSPSTTRDDLPDPAVIPP